jgi:single-strand DNA-binding protein
MNCVIISGIVSKNATVTYSQNKLPVTQFGICVKEKTPLQKNTSQRDRINFFDCIIFGELGKEVSEQIIKDRQVYIEGRLRWDKWKSYTGKYRSRVIIIVSRIEFLDKLTTN